LTSMTRRKLVPPLRTPGMAAIVAVALAFGPGLIPGKAQSEDDTSRARRDDKNKDKDLEALQGSWQGHPTATTCTGIFAPVLGNPNSPVCPYTFYTMTTFIPTGIAYGTPVIPGATVGHGRWSHVGYLNFLLRGQIFVNGPAGTPIARGLTQESITVVSATEYHANFKITVTEINSGAVLGTLEGLSVNTRLPEPP
jgi:hypothetical protein